MVQDVKGKTNWGVGGRDLQLLNSTQTSSESWQLPSEEQLSVGSGESFQIPESWWRSSDSSNLPTDFLRLPIQLKASILLLLPLEIVQKFKRLQMIYFIELPKKQTIFL